MPKKYAADAPEQQQHPSPSAITGSLTVESGAVEMQAMNAFHEHPYAPPVPQQPSCTTTITLPSGISVNVPKD